MVKKKEVKEEEEEEHMLKINFKLSNQITFNKKLVYFLFKLTGSILYHINLIFDVAKHPLIIGTQLIKFQWSG